MWALTTWRSQRTADHKNVSTNMREQLLEYSIDTALDTYDISTTELSLFELVFGTTLLSVSCKTSDRINNKLPGKKKLSFIIDIRNVNSVKTVEESTEGTNII
jgi:hypothetical protein